MTSTATTGIDDDPYVANRHPHLGERVRWRPRKVLFAVGFQRLPLLCVLALQTMLTLRLTSTAFQDEALYLYAGHREVAQLLHGTPTYDNYASYFSGAPMLYPVLGGAVDGVFGLTGARTLSLLLMLLTTTLLYATTTRLLDRRSAALAAGVFAVSEPTLFMGHLATFDAPALFLLALASWLTVRSAGRNPFWVALAAPELVLAAATKYAALLYAPTVVALAVLCAVPAAGWGRAILRGATLAVVTGGLVVAALALSGPGFRAGIRTTTSARAAGTDSTLMLLRTTGAYIGGAVLLALCGAALFAHAGRGTAGNRMSVRVHRKLLGSLLVSTALLAPAYQIHLHTATSLQKHVGYGLWFAAPMAGYALSRFLTAAVQDSRRLGAAAAICLLLAWNGTREADNRFHDWPNSAGLTSVLMSEVRPVTGRYLVEESEVPRYYLRNLAAPYQWTGTYYFSYTQPNGQVVTGAPAYRAAIAAQYFDVIALRYGPTASLDVQIDALLRSQHGYRLIAQPRADSSYGKAIWYIWQAQH